MTERLPRFTLLERVTVTAPLGIRFWDPALDAPIGSGLLVTAHRYEIPAAPVEASCTPSGVYAFRGLPGLHDTEYPSAESANQSSPPFSLRFVIQVEDPRWRFLPAVFPVELPYDGIFPPRTSGSPPNNGPSGLELFCAPTRPRIPVLAAVRAQLIEPPAGSQERPAAYALLEVEGPNGTTWKGAADERGMVLAMFPYPPFQGTAGGSPPTPRPQRWDLAIRVRYDPPALFFPEGFNIPSLRSLSEQRPGNIWSSTTGPGQPVNELSAELFFGQELVLRTDSGPALFVGAAGS